MPVRSSLVTICVPAHDSRDVIVPTLDSLARQTLDDFQVILSVDLGRDNTADYLDAIVPDDRFVVRRRSRRLSWAANVNAALDEVATRFACVVSHGDTVTANYLAELVAALDVSPDSTFAMPAALTRGCMNGEALPRQLRGEVPKRLADWVALSTNEALLPWRALVRREALDAGLRLRGQTELFADRLWALDLVIAGGGAVAPKAVYLTDRSDAVTKHGWEDVKAELKADPLDGHIEDVVATFRSSGLTDGQTELLSMHYAASMGCLGVESIRDSGSKKGTVVTRLMHRPGTSAEDRPVVKPPIVLPRVAATMVVRDQCELLSLNLDHHLGLGLEHVFVTDHSSGVETQSLLKSMVLEGSVTVMRVRDTAFDQATWCSAMAKRAYEGGYDWVVHLDADEFLWAPGMDVPTTLSGLRETESVVRLSRWNVVPLRTSARWSDSPMARDLLSMNSAGRRIQPKVMHRAVPDATMTRGNHAVTGAGLGSPVEVEGLFFLHIPLTTYAEFEAATRIRSAALALGERGSPENSAHWLHDAEALRSGSLRAEFEARLPTEVHSDGVSRWQAETKLPRRLADLRAHRADRQAVLPGKDISAADAVRDW